MNDPAFIRNLHKDATRLCYLQNK